MDVNGIQFQEMIAKEPGVVLDVRSAGEYMAGRIPGAKNADVMTPHAFESGISTLNKDQRLYVYCRSGGRSGVAVQMLRSKGFGNIVHLATGIMGWPGPIE